RAARAVDAQHDGAHALRLARGLDGLGHALTARDVAPQRDVLALARGDLALDVDDRDLGRAPAIGARGSRRWLDQRRLVPIDRLERLVQLVLVLDVIDQAGFAGLGRQKVALLHERAQAVGAQVPVGGNALSDALEHVPLQGFDLLARRPRRLRVGEHLGKALVLADLDHLDLYAQVVEQPAEVEPGRRAT